MSQVTDLAEQMNWDFMENQVITMEHELKLCSFVEGFSHLTSIQNFCLFC